MNNAQIAITGYETKRVSNKITEGVHGQTINVLPHNPTLYQPRKKKSASLIKQVINNIAQH